jgi:hypothetical protein
MNVEIVLGCLHYDFVLTVAKPVIRPTVTDAQKAATQLSIYKWVKVDKMSILIIKSCYEWWDF